MNTELHAETLVAENLFLNFIADSSAEIMHALALHEGSRRLSSSDLNHSAFVKETPLPLEVSPRFELISSYRVNLGGGKTFSSFNEISRLQRKC